ncbi:hypothetical protein AN958_08176 [Leucoagaricus sp. SymC.cos]|nr:hypothetical protein AN958_08176 [Leucoagaricus sp. SymC.cos]
MRHGNQFASLLVLPGEPYEPEVKLYNCLRHYTVASHTAEDSRLRVKALRVPGLFPYQRCLAELRTHLGDKWRLVQEHRYIAPVSFLEAFECETTLPQVYPFPTVLVMKEYKGNILEYIDRFEPSFSERSRWVNIILFLPEADDVAVLTICHS